MMVDDPLEVMVQAAAGRNLVPPAMKRGNVGYATKIAGRGRSPRGRYSGANQMAWMTTLIMKFPTYPSNVWAGWKSDWLAHKSD